MRFKFLIIPSALIFQFATAQNGSASLTLSGENTAAPASAVSSPTVMPPDPVPASVSPESTPIAIMDYKSVYEAATVEEEVKMAAERFELTKAQQDIWLTAATDRRLTEKQVSDKLNSKNADYTKEGVYRGLRSAHTTFHETIIGYLTPAQKGALETDRLILEEKQKRLAKLPPPPAPTVTVAPVDSAAIKKEEKSKVNGKKSKKKRKPAGG